MKERSNKKGVALLTAVLAMLILTVFAMGFAVETGTDVDSGRAYLDKVKTFYIAQAGMNRARTAITVGEETAYTLPPNSAIDPVAEDFGEGQFDVVANSDTSTVSITSVANIGTRTLRTVEENNIQRGSSTPQATASDGNATAPNAVDYGSGLDNSGLKYGFGNIWNSTTKSANTWIEIDYGEPVSFDHVIFVNGTSCTIGTWTLEVWNDTNGSYNSPQVSTSSSAWGGTIGNIPSKSSDAPAWPNLGTQNYWVAVNFTRQGYTTQDTPDCDNNPATSDSLDHCIGVLTPGVQTSSRVKMTATNVSCPGGQNYVGLDWVQAKENGSLAWDGLWHFNGTDAREQMTSGMLESPSNFAEK